MPMKRVRSGEVDTPDEIAVAMNRIIDNVNQTAGKVEQLESCIQSLTPTPAKKKKGDKDA